MVYRTLDYKESSDAIYLPILGCICIHWTGLEYWTHLSPQKLTRHIHFKLIGSPSCPFSGREDNYQQYSYMC